ncbi:hypothetical protein E3J85_01095 [Patescibacteria group bacterium]|nr:MAG: hypothetical protein E3J85_01095 [Patescibacteria group bacterium]
MKKLMIFGVFILAVVLILPGCSSFSPRVEVSKACPVRVDYSLSLAEMIDAGHYDWVNEDIFSYPFVAGDPSDYHGQEEVQLYLVRFGRQISSDDVYMELDKIDLRPATIAELLALGAKYFRERQKHPVVALGSILHSPDYGHVASLERYYLERHLSLYYFYPGWHYGCCFLAAPK